MTIVLTREIAHIAGWDVGNRSMRAAGRKRWNMADWDSAADETNRLLALISLPEIVEAMRADGLVS